MFPVSLINRSTALGILVAILSALFAAAPASNAADLNTQEQAIFNSMRTSSGQRRPFLVLDPILCKVARQKAADMAARHYFAHTDPSGHGANYLVRAQGYVLPAGYDTSPSGNNIESLSAGRDTASWAWNDWMSSSLHKRHLLGEDPFFAAQTSVGVGFVNVPGSEWQWYWVVLSAPPSGPQLAISAPATGAKVYAASLKVAGTTGGEPAATSVRVRIENSASQGEWIAATGTASWSANLDGLVPGTNTLRVQSLNASGGVLREMTRGVRYIVMAPVTVNIAGSGGVTAGFVGTSMRQVGVPHTITATPKAGFLFAGWSGDASDLSRRLTFTPVLAGTTLNANFIPNPFTAGVGGYSTLFTGTDGSHGRLNLSLTSNGAFTGSIRLDDQTLTVKGRFDALGHAQVTVKNKAGDTYALALNYSNDNGVGSVAGTINGNGWSADLSLGGYSKPGTAPNPNAGRYTLVLSNPQTGAGEPSGDGAATVVVTKSGIASVSGALADGRTFSARARLLRDNKVALFVAPYAGKGLLTGTLTFQAQQYSDLDGRLYWARPAQESALRFASGFAADLGAVGNRYQAPKPGEPVVPVTAGSDNTALALGDGGLTEPVVQPATLSPSNSLVISKQAVTGLTARLNVQNGVFSGTFVHPTTRELATFRGVILQKQGAGFGFFAGGTKAGYATFTPAGSQASLAAQQ